MDTYSEVRCMEQLVAVIFQQLDHFQLYLWDIAHSRLIDCPLLYFLVLSANDVRVKRCFKIAVGYILERDV